MNLRNRVIAFFVTIAMVLNNILSPVSVWYGERYAYAAESQGVSSSSPNGQVTGRDGGERSGVADSQSGSVGPGSSTSQPAAPLVLKKTVTAGKEPAPGEPDTRRTYAVQVTYDAGAGIPEGAELEVSEVQAKDEQKKAAREQLKLAEHDRVVAETYLKVAIKSGGKEVQPSAPVEVVVETASMDPSFSDAVEAVVLGEKDASVAVENLTGRRDDGTEDEKPKATRLRLKTARLGELALAAVAAPFDTWVYNGQTTALLGPRNKRAEASETLYDEQVADGKTLLRTVTFRTEPEHAWHPALWVESRLGEGHDAAAGSVSCWRWEDGRATAKVFGEAGTSGPVAIASDGEYAFALEQIQATKGQDQAGEELSSEIGTPSQVVPTVSQDPSQQHVSTNPQVTEEAVPEGGQAHSTPGDQIAQAEAEVETRSLGQTYTASDGRTYRVTVSASDEANIPANAELTVGEVAHNSTAYLSYATRATNALGVKPSTTTSIRALDITLKDPVSGKELQPTEDVKVSVELLKEDPSRYARVGVVHMRENPNGGAARPEVVASDVRGMAVEFGTDGFSVYVVVLADSLDEDVDVQRKALAFTREDQGEQVRYAYSGDGQTITLSSVLAGLGITGVVTSVDATGSEEAPSSLTVMQDGDNWIIATTNEFTSGTITVTTASDTITINVSSKSVIVIKAEDWTKRYGEDDPTLTAHVLGLPDGDDGSSISYTISRQGANTEEGERLGSYAITPTGDAFQGDYVVFYKTGTLEILPWKVNVTANNSTKNYGDPDALTARVTGLREGDDESAIVYTIARDGGENVGSYTITPSGEASQGYYNVTYIPGTLTINPAPVTVKANDAEKVAGTVDPDFTAMVTGLKNGDPESSVTYVLSRPDNSEDNPGYADREKSGEHAIVPTGEATQGNYAVTYEDGILKINKLAIAFKNGDETVRTCGLELGQPIGEVDNLAGVSKTGCDFKDWCAQGSTEPVTLETTFSASTDLHARFTVSVNFNDGTSNPPETKTVDEGAQIGALPEVSKAGHRFDGWYRTPELTGERVKETDAFSAHATLYAKFVEQATVSFEVATTEKDGTTTESKGTTKVDKGASLRAEDFPQVTAPEGYVFKGWFVGDVRIDDGTEHPISADTTVTARVVKQTTITYRAENAQGAIETFATDAGDVNRSVSFPTPAPTLAGAEFKGWYDGETQVSDRFTADSDKTLNAHYTVTATFLVKDASYQTITSETPVVVDRGTAIDGKLLGDPVLEGYKFKGWFVADVDGKPSNTQVTAETSFVTHTTVVAKFAKQITVTFETGGTRTEYTVDAGDPIELVENPVKPDARFDGWFDENGKRVSNAEGVVDDEGNLIRDGAGNPVRTLTPTRDMKLSARFVDQVTVEFVVVHPETRSSSTGYPSLNSEAKFSIDKTEGGVALPQDWYDHVPNVSGYYFLGWYHIKKVSDNPADYNPSDGSSKFVIPNSAVDGKVYELDEENPVYVRGETTEFPTFTDNTILVAKFAKEVTITFRFDNQGGTNEVVVKDRCLVGKPLSDYYLPLEQPSTDPEKPSAYREGYRIEWLRNGTKVDPDYEISATDDNAVYDARYVRQVTVTFRDENGNEIRDTSGNVIQPVTLDANTTLGMLPEVAETIGTGDQERQFMGWFDENGKQYAADMIVTADVALKAKYGYEVVFKVLKENSDTEYENVMTRKVAPGDPLGWTPGAPFRAGKSFRNWTMGGEVIDGEHVVSKDETYIGNYDDVQIYMVTINYTVYKNGVPEVEPTDTKVLTVDKSAVTDQSPVKVASPSQFNKTNPTTTYYPVMQKLEIIPDGNSLGVKEKHVDVIVETDPSDAAHIIITVPYKEANASYTVRYMLKNLTGNGYSLIESASLEGVIGASVSPDVREYDYADFESSDYGYLTDDKVYNVYYARKYFTLTYDTKGGKAIDSVVALYGSTVTLPTATSDPKAEREGYTFDGWYTSVTENTYTGKVTGSYTLMRNTTLYAKWNPKTVNYSIVYMFEKYNDAGTASGFVYDSTRTGSGTVGNVVRANDNGIPSISRKGWEKDTTRNANSSTTIEADGSTVLYVYYKLREYTFEFNLNHNNNNTTMVKGGVTYRGNSTTRYKFTAKVGQSLDGLWPTTDNATFNRNNYKFSGWQYPNGSIYVTKRLIVTDDMLPSNNTATSITYSAYWLQSTVKYTVNYLLQNANDNNYTKSEVYSQTYNYSSGSSLSPKEIMGYTYDHSANSGNTYNFYYNRDTFKIDYYYGSLLLKTISNIKFDANINSATYNFVPDKQAAGVEPDYEGGKWYTDSSCTSEYTFDKMPASNLVLYTDWNAPKYLTSFYLNYDGVDPELEPYFQRNVEKYKTVTAGLSQSELDRLNTPAPAPEHFEFVNWYTDPTGGEIFDPAGKTITENTDVYAHWKPKDVSYTVHYYKAGTTEPVLPSRTVTGNLVVGQEVTEEAPYVTGYNLSPDDPDATLVADAGSKTIVLDHENNVITFYYGKKPDEISYTVRYVLFTDKDKPADQQIEVAPSETRTVPGSYTSVTETAVAPTAAGYEDYRPTKTTDSLPLGTDAGQNVLTFYYTRGAHLTVKWLDMEGDSVRGAFDTYLDMGRTYDLETAVGGYTLDHVEKNGARTDDRSFTATSNTEQINVIAYFRKNLTVLAHSANKPYDGTALTLGNVASSVTTEGLKEGHTLTGVKISGSQTNVGVSECMPYDVAVGGLKNGLTADQFYNITPLPGSLTVTRVNVIISVEPDRWTGNIYNGTYKQAGFTNGDKTIEDYVVINNEAYKAAYINQIWENLKEALLGNGRGYVRVPNALTDKATGERTVEGLQILNRRDAGDYYEESSYFQTALTSAINAMPSEAKDNYNLILYAREARLEIGRAPLLIKTEGAGRPYNGTPLTNEGITVKVDETEITPDGNNYTLAEGDTVSIRATGSQTHVGTSQNIYEIAWGEVNQENYALAEDLGTLEVTARPLVVDAQDLYKAFGAASDPSFAVKVYPGKIVDGQVVRDESESEIPATLTRWAGDNYTLQLNDTGRSYTDNLSIKITRDPGDVPGTYVIKPDWAADAVQNYNAAFINGKLTIAIARVSGDNGATWTYHQWLENDDLLHTGSSYDAATDDPSRQGAFDRARALGGNVIVETLCENRAFLDHQIPDRYVLGKQVALTDESLGTLTLRTTEGADFTSVVYRGYEGTSLFANSRTLTLGNITLNGNSSSYVGNTDGGLVNVQQGGTLNVTSGATLTNSAVEDGRKGNAVFVADGGAMNMSGGSITGNNHGTGSAVEVGGAGARLTFSGGAKVYDNLTDGAQHNVCLSYDDAGVINATGLATDAKVGVYVKDTADASGATDGALFKTRGGVLDRFGTFTNSANLSAFVNDRNGLKGTAHGENEVVWVQPVTVEARYMYNLKDYATMPTQALNAYTLDPSKYVVLADIEYVPTFGESQLVYDPTSPDKASFTIDQIERDIYNNYGGSNHGWSSAATNTMVFWRGYSGSEREFNAYLKSLHPDTNNGKWAFDKNADASDLVPVGDDKLVLYYTEPAYIEVSNHTGLAMTNNAMTVLLPGYGRAVGDATTYGAPNLQDPAAVSVFGNAYLTKVGDAVQQKPYGRAELANLQLADEGSVTLMIPGAVGAMYWVDGGFVNTVEDVTLVSVMRNGGTAASNEKTITLDTLGTRDYPSTATPKLPVSRADAANHHLYGGLTQNTTLRFGEAYICKITDADGNLLRVDGKIQAFKSLEEGFKAYADNATNAYVRRDGTAAEPKYIKMLVEDYDLKLSRLGGDFQSWTSAVAPENRSVTLTTAPTTDEELPGPYERTPETRCLINRGTTCTSSMISVPKTSNLTTENVILDGGATFSDEGVYESGEVDVSGGIMNVAANGSVTLGEGSTLRNTAVKSTDASNKKGGAIYADKNSTLTITGTASNRVEFTNCQANGGGAIYNPEKAGFTGTVSMEYCTFSNCFAKGTKDDGGQCAGGAVRCMASKLTMDNCKFENCVSVQQGGAVYHLKDGAAGTEFQATYCDFTSCMVYDPEKKVQAASGGAESQARSVTVDDCKFTDCSSSKNAGAFNVYNTNATINVKNSTFSNCRANGTGTGDFGNGGALRTTGSSTTVENCTFDSCEANNRGGAIHCKTNTKITGTTVITNCKANVYGGGAVFLENGTLTFESGTVQNCQAPDGGAVYQGGGTLNMTGGTITGCTATKQGNNNGLGGGVYLGGGTFNMSGGSIKNCNAYSNGGGVCLNATGAKFNLTGGTISGCNSPASGGGVYMGSGTFAFSGGEINTCNAKTGGGVYINGTSTATISKNGVAIRDCKAVDVNVNSVTGAFVVDAVHDDDNKGGGLYQNGGSLTITRATINGCSAYDGGGIYLKGDSRTELNVGTNGASNGGTISNCTAVKDGGGIYQENGKLNVYDGTSILKNGAENGGGIYQGGGTQVIHNGSIKENKAQVNGGGIYLGVGSFTLESGEVGGLNADETSNGGNEARRGGGLFVGNGTEQTPTVASIKGGLLGGNHATEIAGGGGIAIGGPNVRLYFEGSIQVWGNTMEPNPNYPHQTRCDVCLSEDSDVIIQTTSTGLNEDSHIGVYVTDAVVQSGDHRGQQLHRDLHGTAGLPFGTFSTSGNGDSSLNRFINNRSGNAYDGYEYYYGIRKPVDETHRIYWAEYVCEITDAAGNMLFSNNRATAPALYQYLGKQGAFEALTNHTQFYNRDKTPYTSSEYYVRMLVLDYDLKWTEATNVPNLGTITLMMAAKDDPNLPQSVKRMYDRKGGVATIKRGNCTSSMLTTAAGSDLIVKSVTLDGGAQVSNGNWSHDGKAHAGLVTANGNVTLGEKALLRNSYTSNNASPIVYNGPGTLTMNSGAVIDTCRATNGSVLYVNASGATDTNPVNVVMNEGALIRNCPAGNGLIYVNAGVANLSGTFDYKKDDNDTSYNVVDSTATNGGVAYVNGGTLNVNGAVRDFSATNGGGAAYVLGGTLNVSNPDASISYCSAPAGGAILAAGGSARVNISNGTISNNEATAANKGGAALRIEGGAEATISGGTISENRMVGTNDKFGGAINLKKGSLTISGGTISGNTVTAGNNKSSYGSAVHVSGTNDDYGYLTITGGTISGNTATGGSAYGGAISVVGANASATISGGTISGNVARGTNQGYYSLGGAVYVANGGLLTLTGGAITANTAEGTGTVAGAGIYLDATSKMNISGAPTFHADGMNDNTVTIAGYETEVNGGESVYAGNKVRQDIFIAEDNGDAPQSITVAGDLTGGDGSIWVWAQNESHYRQHRPFAKLGEGVTFVGEEDEGASGFEVAHLKVFRNAQDDGTTGNVTEEYLYGTMEETGPGYVWWTGVAGTRKVILRKVGEGNAPLAGAQFRIMSTSWKDIEKDEQGNGVVYESDASGVYFVGDLPYGTYRLVETTFPDGYGPAGFSGFDESDPSTYWYYDLYVGDVGQEIPVEDANGDSVKLDARGTYVDVLRQRGGGAVVPPDEPTVDTALIIGPNQGPYIVTDVIQLGLRVGDDIVSTDQYSGVFTVTAVTSDGEVLVNDVNGGFVFNDNTGGIKLLRSGTITFTIEQRNPIWDGTKQIAPGAKGSITIVVQKKESNAQIVNVAIDGVMIPIDFGYITENTVVNDDRDVDAICDNGGLEKGRFYTIGSKVYFCHTSVSDRNEIRYNRLFYMAEALGFAFSYADGSVTYAGDVVDGDSGSFGVTRGGIVRQNGRYYICFSYGGYFQNVNCETETDRLYRIY